MGDVSVDAHTQESKSTCSCALGMGCQDLILGVEECPENRWSKARES